MNGNIHKLFLTATVVLLIIPGCRQLNEEGSDIGSISPNLYHVEKFIISQPEENDYFSPGETIAIEWLTFSSIAKADIFLYRKSQSQFAITLNEKNTGSYSWEIPQNIRPSLHYSIKVVNSSNNREFNFSGSFSILN
jgi:Kre9/KNH-like N-terminal Ig-like domain